MPPTFPAAEIGTHALQLARNDDMLRDAPTTGKSRSASRTVTCRSLTGGCADAPAGAVGRDSNVTLGRGKSPG